MPISRDPFGPGPAMCIRQCHIHIVWPVLEWRRTEQMLFFNHLVLFWIFWFPHDPTPTQWPPTRTSLCCTSPKIPLLFCRHRCGSPEKKIRTTSTPPVFDTVLDSPSHHMSVPGFSASGNGMGRANTSRRTYAPELLFGLLFAVLLGSGHPLTVVPLGVRHHLFELPGVLLLLRLISGHGAHRFSSLPLPRAL